MSNKKEPEEYTYWNDYATSAADAFTVTHASTGLTNQATTTSDTVWINGTSKPTSSGNYHIHDVYTDKDVSNPIPATMDFHDGEKYVGTFKFKDGELTFEGEIEDSAKILFQQFKKYVDKYIKDASFKVKLDSATE